MKKPFIVEFLGTPEAGKTTTVRSLCKKLGKEYSTEYIQESAERKPDNIPKGSLDGHWWIRMNTVDQILEAKYCGKDIALVDRGLVDSIFWNVLFCEQGKLSEEEKNIANSFLLQLNLFPDLCIIFTVSAEECIRRRGGEGSIVNFEFIESYNKVLKEFCDRFQNIKMIIIDTTNLSKEEVEAIVYKKIQEFI